MKTLIRRLRQHSVALISLAIALSSLAYNTWRNEQSEANRNVRAAGIELLLKLGDLDRVVFYSHYDKNQSEGNPRAGWAFVLTARDLGTLMREPAKASTRDLLATWTGNWQGLGSRQDAVDSISASIDRTRQDVLAVLGDLE